MGEGGEEEEEETKEEEDGDKNGKRGFYAVAGAVHAVTTGLLGKKLQKSTFQPVSLGLISPINTPPPPHCSIHLQVKTAAQSTVTDGTKLSEYVELVDGIYLNEIMLEM